jgi:methionyl-tRNA formyltransferase
MARIAVAATAPFGADVLERLAARHEVVQLVTRPDRPRGRGRKLAPPPATVVAERLGIPVSQPERLDPSVELDADTVVVAAYGLLVPETLLDRALWLNVHPSLLPRWRGAAPVERAIMSGDERSGVSIIKLVRELDAGPIAAQRELAIPLDWTAGDFYAAAAETAEELLAKSLRERRFVPQDEDGVTYAEKITAADRELDWTRPPKEIHDRIRALSPHIGARGVVDGRELIVWRSRLRDDGSLELLEVQPPGGLRMAYEAYLRGLR